MSVEGRSSHAGYGFTVFGRPVTPADFLAAVRTYAISRTRPTKRWIAMLVDAGLCAITCYAAIFLRLGFIPDRDTPYAVLVAASVGLALPIFWALGLYREIFSQSGIRAIVNIARACSIYALPFAAIFTVLRVWGIPRTLSLIQPILLFVAIAGSRVLARYWLFGTDSARRARKRRVLIYGAGSAGRQLAGAIAQSSEMMVVGYFDDNPNLIGSVIDGRRIFDPAQMAKIVESQAADEILLALPSAPRMRRNEIIAVARSANAHVRTLPGLMDIAHGRVEIRHIRELEVEDLLGRSSVDPDDQLMKGAIFGQTIMVTGAGGSIGSELCRQLIAFGPATLLLLELSEFALYEVHRELESRSGRTRVVPLLGSVCDEARVEEIISAWRPDVIYHAAAYKHVPLVEHNPGEGIRTNVFGTFTLAQAAARLGVPRFVLVSTDKAVRPTSVMGATKRAAELVLQALNQVSPQTCFSMVRFGNVLGTSGSVVPLFRQQIRVGGPVTLTDRRITRYFMTVPEAAQLVLQASAMASGGELFVLDMGQPVQIAELARNMIELSGLTVRTEDNPAGDVEIVEIGLRPGEKLYEELLIGTDPSPTEHPLILKAKESFIPFDELSVRLGELADALASGSRVQLIAALHDLVAEFQDGNEVVDWVHLESADVPRRIHAQRAATSI
jgi:FlaA1/EpsC-like NDP-sugar epimerase